jgi:hypothetical protein
MMQAKIQFPRKVLPSLSQRQSGANLLSAMIPNIITDYLNKFNCAGLFEHYQITFQEAMKQATAVCEALKTGVENMKQTTKSLQLYSNSTTTNLHLEAKRSLQYEQHIKICRLALGFRQFLTIKFNG